MWEDADFKTMKMDEYCMSMWEALDLDVRLLKMLRNWQETWERKPVGPMGDVVLLEMLKCKYVGFKLDENEGDQRSFTVHAIEFKRENCRKYFQMVGVTKEFNTMISIEENDLQHYDVRELCSDTYDCFHVYYDEFAQEDGVLVYKKGGVCDSKDEE